MLFLLLNGIAHAQGIETPKFIRGDYSGTQTGYVVRSAGKTFQVDSAILEMKVGKVGFDLLFQPQNKVVFKNIPIYSIEKSKVQKKQWIIKLKIVESTFMEELVYDKKKKTILRMGIPPQPNTVLSRLKKKTKRK